MEHWHSSPFYGVALQGGQGWLLSASCAWLNSACPFSDSDSCIPNLDHKAKGARFPGSDHRHAWLAVGASLIAGRTRSLKRLSRGAWEAEAWMIRANR